MMRFLANENFPGSAVAAFTAAGDEVVWIRSAAPGIGDAEVLVSAAREGRILLTFDEDFGELARAVQLPEPCGIVPVCIPMRNAGDAGRTVAAAVMARDDWQGHFSVIEPGRIRMGLLR
jgi:predicted nuclease of predicted toxin-antitoxin system